MPSNKTNFTMGIWLVLLFALATMFGAGSGIYYFSREFERDTSQRYNDKQYEHVQGIARDLREVLTLIQKDLEYVATLPEVQEMDGAQSWPQLAAFIRRFGDHVNDIARIDAEGRFLATSQTELRQAGVSALHRPSTQLVLRTHAVALAGPYTTLDGTKAISLDVPVFRKDKITNQITFTGTLSCRIDIDRWVKSYVTPYDVHLASFTWIINSNREIVAHSNAKLIGESWEHIAQAAILDPSPEQTDRHADYAFLTRALVSKGGKEQITLGSLGDQLQLVAYAPLRVAGTQWVVISNAPRKAVLQPFHENLRNVYIVASGFVGLFFLVVILSLRSEQHKVQTERELRYSLQQSEKKYRTLIERSNDGILLASPDGFIKLVNKRFTELIGEEAEQLIGQNIRDYVAPNHREKILQEWQRRERGMSSSYELELIRSSSKPITVICSESPVFNRNNEHIGNLSVLTDITEKKRAEEEIKRQNADMFAINAIARTVNQSLILDEIFKATADKICETLQLDTCLIAEIIEKTRDMRISASVGCSPEYLESPGIKDIQLGVGYAGISAEKGELIIVNDLTFDDGSIGDRPALPAFRREGIISGAFVPIKSSDRCFGIISCGSYKHREFSDQDIRLLQTIGQTIGLAVEKAMLYQNARRRAMRLETIYQVSDRLTALLELDELLPAVVKLIHETFNYYNVNILLLDRPTGQLVFIAGCGGFQRPEPLGARITPPEGIVGWCFHRREPVIVDDVHKEPRFMFIESLPETKSELAVPLVAHGEAIGVLDVQSSYTNAFDEEDLLTLQTLAEQIAVAVENAQLYERIKHSLDEVRKSQAFFAKIVLESPLSTIITDANGTCILINQSAMALLGADLAYDEVVGKYNIMRDPPFAGSEIINRLTDVLAGEVVQLTLDLPVVDHPRQDTLSLRATMFPLMDDTNKVANIVAKFEDLSEKKQLEEALRQAQKMESIGTLAGGIAHDFNNILGGVLGYTSFIKTKMTRHDPLYRYINIIESSARRAADLTQQLLAFARGGKYRVQTLDLNKIVQEAIELIESTISKNITVTQRLLPSLPPMEGDSGQIIQTIVNMCINARDAMPEGGQLVISTSIAELNEQISYKHPGAQPGRYLLLTVTDTGHGMDDETMRRIFEPFFTTKRDKKGTGLGLAMVYGIIKNHGGFIDVESGPNQGTTFFIYLPVSTKQLLDTTTATMKPLKRGSETILIAEDEDIMRDLLVEMLDSGGYQVISAENGRTALDIYRERAPEIDLVILDMVMPDLGGHEAFRQLKQINPDVKVLLSSGYSQDSQAQQIINEGVLGFIQKPYGVNELLDKIRVIIDTNSFSNKL